MLVPYLESTHACHLSHQSTVFLHTPDDCLPVLLNCVSILPTSHNDAGSQAFQVPLPGTWKCLVEVVDIEDEVAFWHGEEAEVAQVRIPADLHLDTGDGSVRQVPCHHPRRAE